MANVIKVNRTDAVSILQTLGFKDKAKLANDKLVGWMDKLGKFVESVDVTWTGKQADLVETIVANQGNIEVTGQEPKAVKKAVKSDKPKTAKPTKDKGEKKESTPRLTPSYADVLAKGILKPGQKFYFTYGPRGGKKHEHSGIIRKDGIEITVKGKTLTQSLTQACKSCMQADGNPVISINGWVNWKRQDGTHLRAIVESFGKPVKPVKKVDKD